MTSPRRKRIKWKKWQSKNPDKIHDAMVRKISRLQIFDKAMKRRLDKAFKAEAELFPLNFAIKAKVFEMKINRLIGPTE